MTLCSAWSRGSGASARWLVVGVAVSRRVCVLCGELAYCLFLLRQRVLLLAYTAPRYTVAQYGTAAQPARPMYGGSTMTLNVAISRSEWRCVGCAEGTGHHRQQASKQSAYLASSPSCSTAHTSHSTARSIDRSLHSSPWRHSQRVLRGSHSQPHIHIQRAAPSAIHILAALSHAVDAHSAYQCSCPRALASYATPRHRTPLCHSHAGRRVHFTAELEPLLRPAGCCPSARITTEVSSAPVLPPTSSFDLFTAPGTSWLTFVNAQALACSGSRKYVRTARMLHVGWQRENKNARGTRCSSR